MAINRDFPGLRAFSANFATDRIEEVDIPQPMVKSATRFGAPKPSYRHFSHPAGHGRGRFLSRKTPKMAINRYFPGLRAFSANFATDRIEEVEIPHPMDKSAARFRAPDNWDRWKWPVSASDNMGRGEGARPQKLRCNFVLSWTWGMGSGLTWAVVAAGGGGRSL